MTTEERFSDKHRNLYDEFKNLPVSDKIAALFEFELMTVAEGFEKLSECSISLGKKIFDSVLSDSRRTNQDQRGAPEEDKQV